MTSTTWLRAALGTWLLAGLTLSTTAGPTFGADTGAGTLSDALDASALGETAEIRPALTDFRDVRRPNDIAAGPHPASGHEGLHFTGTAGAGGDSWMTIYDPEPSGPPTIYGSVRIAADVLSRAYNNKKGAGLLALYNQGPGKKGLALILYNAGNTDTLVLATVDQVGKLATVQTVRLGSAIAEGAWYRVSMEVSVGDGLVSVHGTVHRHRDHADPTSPVTEQVRPSLNLIAAPLGVGALAGVEATGEVGVISNAVSAANNTSVTGITIESLDDLGGPIIFD